MFGKAIIIGLFLAGLALAQPVASSGGYSQIQDEGVNRPRQRRLNFVGAGVSVANDAANGRTNVTIAGGGGGSSVWSDLTAPTANLSLAMAAFTSLFTTGTGTGTSNIWTFQDTTGNTGTGYLFNIHSIGTSTLLPLRVTAGGTANGVDMSTAGLLKPIGTGGIQASVLSLSANPTNCPAGQFPLGIDTAGAAESCTALPTSIVGTANQITVSSPTGTVTLSIPTNPTLPGTTTGVFAGDLSGVRLKVSTATGTYAATTSDFLILCDTSGGSVTVNLPAVASSCASGFCQVLNIKKTSASNTCTLDGNAAETIDGSATVAFTDLNTNVQIQADGSNWRIL